MRSSLRKIKLPANIKYIDIEAFAECKNLKEVDFSLCTNLTAIQASFQSCPSLNFVDLSNCTSLKKLDNSYIFRFSGLMTMVLPPNLETLSMHIFNGCQYLNFIEIPSSVRQIEIPEDSPSSVRLKILTSDLPTLNISKSSGLPIFYVPKGSKSKWSNVKVGVQEYDPSKSSNLKLTFDENIGTVKTKGLTYHSGENINVEDGSLLFMYLEIKDGYHLKSKSDNLGSYGNLIYFANIFDQTGSLEFKKDDPASLMINYSEGGIVKYKNQTITAGSSFTIDALRDIKLEIIPEDYYYIEHITAKNKSFKREGNIITLPAKFYSNEEVNVSFKKETFQITIDNVLGATTINVNGKDLSSRQSITVDALTDVLLSLVPPYDYYLETLKINDQDVTKEVQDNKYTISKITTDKTIYASFKKNKPTTCIITASCSTGGKFIINGNITVSNKKYASVSLNEDTKIELVPDHDYYLAELKVGGQDVTNKVKDNIYIIPSISGEQKYLQLIKEKYFISRQKYCKEMEQ